MHIEYKVKNGKRISEMDRPITNGPFAAEEGLFRSISKGP